MQKFKGFTIIEIVIVISLIGIMTLIISPNYVKNILYVKQKETLSLGRQICLCIVNSEITNKGRTDKEIMKQEIVNEVNNFTKVNVSKEDISIQDNGIVCVSYTNNNNNYKVEINLSNCKYRIYSVDSTRNELIYDDYES